MSELAHQLLLELAPQVVVLDDDPGPRIPAGEDAVRIANVLVLDGEDVGRLAPFALRENERRGMARAAPSADWRLEPREDIIVHAVTQQQRVHIGPPGHVRAARRRPVQQQRHEAGAKRARNSPAKVVRRQLRHCLESPSGTAT